MDLVARVSFTGEEERRRFSIFSKFVFSASIKTRGHIYTQESLYIDGHAEVQNHTIIHFRYNK